MLLSANECDRLTALTHTRWYVAFSGGADSTALLHTLKSTFPKQSITAIHINHQLSQHSDEWAERCALFCKALGVECLVEKVVVDRQVASLESSARAVRYEAFERLCDSGSTLMVGHHRDDQAETFLFRALRGESLAGLAGVPKQRKHHLFTVYRPLLEVSRSDIELYISEHGLQTIFDESNLDTAHARNLIRQSVLPEIERYGLKAKEGFAASARHLRSALLFQESLLASLFETREVIDRFGTWLSPLELVEDQTHWVNEWFRRQKVYVSKNQLIQCVSFFGLVNDNRASVRLSKVFTVYAYRGRLCLVHNYSRSSVCSALSTQFEWCGMQYQVAGEVEKLSDFRITSLQPGDEIRILGRGSPIKLVKFMRELNIPWFWRERLPIIRSQGQIVAVADFELANIKNEDLGEISWSIQRISD